MYLSVPAAAAAVAGPLVHVICGGANQVFQLEEFFAYYVRVLGVTSIAYYHYLPAEQDNGGPLAKEIAKRWGVYYNTLNTSREAYQASVVKKGLARLKARYSDAGERAGDRPGALGAIRGH